MNSLEKNVYQFQHHGSIIANKTTIGLTEEIVLEVNTTTETVST